MTDFILENPTATSTSLVLPDGTILVAWSGEIDGEYRIWAQTFDADGAATSSPVAVSDANSTIGRPNVALLENGTIAFAWDQSDGGSLMSEIKARVMDGDLVAVTGVTAVNSTTVQVQQAPSITALGNGGFVVTFDSSGADAAHDGNVGGVRARMFDSMGVVTAPADFVVNTTIQGAQYGNNVAAIDGGFVATYQSPDSDGTNGLIAKIFDETGAVLQGEINIASTGGEESGGKVFARDGGGFIAAWADSDVNTGDTALRVMAYDATGTALWENQAVIADTIFNVPADMVQLADGSYFLVYVTTADWMSTEIYGHVITADGVLSGDPVPLGESDTAYLDFGSVELLDDGTVLVSWTDGMGQVTTVKSFEIEGGGGEENLAPTDIQITNTKMLESARVGFEVGVLSATDPENDDITYSLVAGENDNSRFKLRTNEDGSVSVVLQNTLDHETSDGSYTLEVMATDSEGNEFTKTIEIAAEEDPFKLSTVPTGKTYTSVVENAPKGTDIGYITQFDTSFVPKSVKLIDDSNGAFKIEKRVVLDETRYYIVTNRPLDAEKLALHDIVVQATDADGNKARKTFDVHVLDANEAGDEARGRITIDAATALAAENGGMNWDTFLDRAFTTTGNSFPSFVGGGGWSPSDPASEYVFTDRADGRILSLEGSDLVYTWNDPASGEDVHVISGNIDNITFGSEGALNEEGTWDFTKTEISITGLDLSNDVSLMARIDGEVNILTSAFMYGSNYGSESWIEFVKALLSSYAQDFLGSEADDRFTGTAHDDTASGGGGADFLRAGAGDDEISGGAGTDRLAGGSGADTFIFEEGDTAKAKGRADTILDFSAKQGDMIDLSALDANTGLEDDQAFTLIGRKTFTGDEGELRYVIAKSDTWIQGDTDGDGKADFVLHLDDAVKLRAEYFEL